MKPFSWLLSSRNRLDLVAGLSDGILTALTLAAGKLLGPEAAMSPGLALRVALAAAVSGAFVFFVAHYAVLRGELVEAERQLNLTAHGRLVTSHLGRAVLIEAMSKALVTAMFSFMGALLPLMVGVLWPILALVVALVTLTVLGGILGNTAHGRPLTWAVSMLVGGIGVLYIGFFLKIV